MVKVIADEFLTDERERKYYADRYSCCPPPLFIIFITLVEVSVSALNITALTPASPPTKAMESADGDGYRCARDDHTALPLFGAVFIEKFNPVARSGFIVSKEMLPHSRR